jgi:hypothetical protein
VALDAGRIECFINPFQILIRNGVLTGKPFFVLVSMASIALLLPREAASP